MKFQLSREDAPWDYPALGFTATTGDAILDGSLFSPPLTTPPDAFWSAYGGGSAETGITRNAPPAVPPYPDTETPEGYTLVYSDDANRFMPADPTSFFEIPAVAAGLEGALADNMPNFYAGSQLAYIAGSGAFMGPKKFLEGGAGHTTWQVLGDSTAGLTGNWVRILADWAADRCPDLRVRYRGLDSSGNYLAQELIQTGTAAVPHVSLVNANYSFAYAPVEDFTEDLSVTVAIKPAAWPPAADGTLIARMNAAPNLGWALYAKTDGKLQFQWSLNGTNLTNVDSPVVSLVTTDFTYIRVLANTTGSDVTVSFESSFDNYNFTAFGTPFTNVGWGPIYQPAGVPVSIGAWNTSGVGSTRFVGDITEAWVRDGSLGPTLAETQVTDWAVAQGASSTVGWMLDVVNGGWPSHALNDLITYGEKLQPQMGASLTILCDGHNDSTWLGVYYAGLLDQWRDIVRARAPQSAIVVTAQNPRVPPATFIDEHAARHAMLAGWASRNGAGSLDVYSLFEDDPRFDGTAAGVLYNADGGGVHPSPVGWQLWADLVIAAILAGL